MHAARVAPGMAVVLGLLVALGATGCDASSAPSSVAAPASQPASPAASVPASAPASPPAVTASATPVSSGGFQNLVVSAAVRSELLVAFAARTGIPLSDVAGSRPDSVYYGYAPATETYNGWMALTSPR
jgi:hypothetical protein